MERQLLVAQLPVLLEQSAAQHRLAGQSLPSGSLDADSTQVPRDQAEHVAIVVQPLRHRFQLTADLVRSEKIEYAGLDGAFLAHCRLRRWQDLESVVPSKIPETAGPRSPKAAICQIRSIGCCLWTETRLANDAIDARPFSVGAICSPYECRQHCHSPLSAMAAIMMLVQCGKPMCHLISVRDRRLATVLTTASSGTPSR